MRPLFPGLREPVRGEELPRRRPRRVVVPSKTFEQILAAGAWPGGADRRRFKHAGRSSMPWIVLENQVTATDERGAVVEFVRGESPLDR